MLEGAVLVEFADGQRYELATGDVLWHVSTLAHRWTSLGDVTARCCCRTPGPAPSPRTADSRLDGAVRRR